MWLRCEFSRYNNFQTQQQERKRFAVCIQIERFVDATIQHVFQDEIQGREFRQHIPPDSSWLAVVEQGSDSFFCNLFDQQREMLRLIRNQADVRRAAFVACAAVGELMQFDLSRRLVQLLFEKRKGCWHEFTRHKT